MTDRHCRNLFRAAVWTLVSRHQWRTVLLLGAVFVLAAHHARAQQPVRYVYDDLGRLIAVVDPTGEAATYVYDAVGNVVSITRTSAAVKVLGLSPYSGPVGATVTIAGTGFSTVATDNVVTFNGTAAQV